MEHLQDKEDRIVGLFAQAEEVIRQTFADEQGMRRFLDYKVRIPGYSANNTAILLAQRPDAKCLGSFTLWKRENTYIHAGEKGVAVLVPAVQAGTGRDVTFKLGWLFDIDQTNLTEERKQELLKQRENIFPAEASFVKMIIERQLQKERTPQEDMLAKEIATYLLYRQFGLSTAELQFAAMGQNELKEKSITDKRKILDVAFQITEYHKREITQLMEEKVKGEEESETEKKVTEEKEADEDGGSTGNDLEVPEAEGKKKIEDFGRKIGGARKDAWRDRGLQIVDLGSMNEAETMKYVTKDNIWKKPNYLQMIKDGTPIRVAFFVKEVRNALPAKVSYPNQNATPEQIRKRQEDYISLIQDVKEKLLALQDENGILQFFKAFEDEGVYIKRDTYYMHMVSRTEKGADVTNRLIKAMQVRNIAVLDRKMEREQFGVDPEHKLPKGYTVRYLNGEYLVIKNRRVLKDGLKSEAEAIQAAREMEKLAPGLRKQSFMPQQLENVKRDGPSYGIDQDEPATGELYMENFGFSGGEFGNWMNEQDRQESLNMGYEAFMDLAAALEIDPTAISLDNRLAIAFGSRGKGGKAAAVAHYEPLLEVINLTKMRGAGSLAHEWGHAFDDILGKKLGVNGFMTTHINDDRVPKSMKELVIAMKMRPATEEEKQQRDEALVKRAEANVERVYGQLLPDTDRLNETEMKTWNRFRSELLGTAEQRGRDKVMEEVNVGHIKWIDEKVAEVSQFCKAVTGHILNKEDRDRLYYAVNGLESMFEICRREMTQPTEFYNNSVKFDSMYSKENKGYWHSDEEMFARAFACYVHDKLAWRSDYLCGHSESAVAFDFSAEETVLIKAIPEGEERKRIDQCFDNVFAEFRELELIKGREEVADQVVRKRGKAR